jgi:2-amino-4-hydroxy-6-hydroxymethyldihydropteridine diphosphokinase
MGFDVALALGGNLGEPERTLRSALIRLAPTVEIRALSSLYLSPPAGGEGQPDYFNATLVGRTALAPEELLAVCKRIEWLAGRRLGQRNAPRPLDIDLLLHGSHRSSRAEITLPHPRLLERAFVVVPLAEIAPDLRLPPTGRRADEVAARLKPGSGIRRVGWSEPLPLLSSALPDVAPSRTEPNKAMPGPATDREPRC